MHRLIKIRESDNVAIPIVDIAAGSVVEDGLVVTEDIPQGHKIALRDLAIDSPIIRYGAILGHLTQPIKRGARVTEGMLRIADAPDLDHLEFSTDSDTQLPGAPIDHFDGFPVEESRFAGTRNILAILPTVQCVSGILNVAVAKMRTELLPKYPRVDDIVVLNHKYGCGVALRARDAEIPIRTLRNLVDNPNFGGEVMIVGLGCEKLTIDLLLESASDRSENVVILQKLPGAKAMIEALMAMAEDKLRRLNKRQRTRLPLSQLCVGMQCGGSDAFSGITANAVAGHSADLLVSAGATVMFSEVTEIRDGAHLLAARCADAEVGHKLIRELKWYDDYLAKGGVDRDANPTPGNKLGGLANVVEKALGSMAKSGRAPIVEVLSPGEKTTKRGLIFAATPASDFVCGTLQLASGMALQVFMTGRGTPYGLAAAPVIKVSSRKELAQQWPDLIDFDAGSVATGEETIQEQGERLFKLIIDVASGRIQPWAERHGLHNDICLFNPAPIT